MKERIYWMLVSHLLANRHALTPGWKIDMREGDNFSKTKCFVLLRDIPGMTPTVGRSRSSTR